MTSMTDENDSLAPGFLIAAPKLEGSPFENAVILMVHHDAQGAMGFIINKPVELDFGSLLENADQPIGSAIDEDSFDRTVLFGGPVRIEQLWVVYHREGAEETVPTVPPESESVDELEEIGELAFHRDWVVAGSGSVIEEFAAGQRDGYYQPLIGYAGWGPGQLESEIEDGSWLHVDFTDELIVDVGPEDCWEAALETVGLDPASFVMMGEGGMA